MPAVVPSPARPPGVFASPVCMSALQERAGGEDDGAAR